MSVVSHHSGLICITLALAFAIVKSIDYNLVPESTDIMTECTGSEGGSMANMDISELETEMLADDVLELKGVIRFKWNLDSTDNFDLIVNTYQEKGSDYVPTVFNAQRRDGCRALFEEGEPWYDTFIKVIPKDYQVCPAQHEEVVWPMEPSNFSMLFKNVEGNNKEGNYKVIVHMKPYDRTGKYYDDLDVCFQVLGYLSRI